MVDDRVKIGSLIQNTVLIRFAIDVNSSYLALHGKKRDEEM